MFNDVRWCGNERRFELNRSDFLHDGGRLAVYDNSPGVETSHIPLSIFFPCRIFTLFDFVFFYCLYIRFIRSSQLVIYRIQSTPSKSSVEWNKEEFTARSTKVGHRQQGHSNALLPDKNMRANKTENKHGEIPLLHHSKQPSQTKVKKKKKGKRGRKKGKGENRWHSG